MDAGLPEDTASLGVESIPPRASTWAAFADAEMAIRH